jgi:quercetin dioxygenase-like cupin family protein
MNVTPYAAAPHYDAPEHVDMRCLRLQGREAGPTESLWIGLSHLLPGGRTSLKASPDEKIYVCIAGEVVVRTETDEVVLRPLDSVRLAPGEPRALENRTNAPATVLLAMPEHR